MTLPVNFIAYGILRRENLVPIVGMTVQANDITSPHGAAKGVTNSSGKFMINLKNHANDGDTISVSCTYQRETKTVNFVLTLSEGTKEINLTLQQVQVLKLGAVGEKPALYIDCKHCGYKNYYPCKDEKYNCHSCHRTMNEEGETGGC